MNKENIFFAYKDSLTLNFRITKKCNADCSYCSSFETFHDKSASLDNFKDGLEYLKQLILKYNLGGKREQISVQYIGGEVLTLSSDFVEKVSIQTKEILSPIFKHYRHGVQTNLIGSEAKIEKLYKIFNNNVGTSYDNFTSQRTIKGNTEKYKTIFIKNVDFLKKTKKISPPGNLVLDAHSSEFILEELKIANENKRGLTIRPIIIGGKNKENLESNILESAMLKAYNKWFMQSRVIIAPFYSMLLKRIANKEKEDISIHSGCAFQHNCANVSLNIEPNGDLYVCQDLAESKNLKLGNIFKKEFDEQLFNEIQKRSFYLENSCYKCDYFKECQGGCMKEAIDHGKDMYGKTEFCSTWKSLFKRIDEDLEKFGTAKIKNWLLKLEMLATSSGEK